MKQVVYSAPMLGFRFHRLALLSIAVLASGCGADEDKRNPVVASGKPLVPASAIEVVIELDTPPGNVTVAPDGRVLWRRARNLCACEAELADPLDRGFYAGAVWFELGSGRAFSSAQRAAKGIDAPS